MGYFIFIAFLSCFGDPLTFFYAAFYLFFLFWASTLDFVFNCLFFCLEDELEDDPDDEEEPDDDDPLLDDPLLDDPFEEDEPLDDELLLDELLLEEEDLFRLAPTFFKLGLGGDFFFEGYFGLAFTFDFSGDDTGVFFFGVSYFDFAILSIIASCYSRLSRKASLLPSDGALIIEFFVSSAEMGGCFCFGGSDCPLVWGLSFISSAGNWKSYFIGWCSSSSEITMLFLRLAGRTI